MAAQLRLTEQSIRKLTPPETGNRITYDDVVPGLGLRVTKAGARSFVLNFHVRGRERRLTIGSFPAWSATAARERAKELRRQIDNGEDPLSAEQQRRGEPTFGDLVQEYLEIEARKQKGFKEYRRLLTRDALPSWRNVRAADIRRRDVIALIERKADTAPIVANRLFELLRRVFNFAIRRDIVDSTPCAQVKKPGQERSKDRVLSGEEIREFWNALDTPAFSAQCAAAQRLILATAQRPGEVVGIEWSEVDLGSAWWTIPALKAKNGLTHRVALNKTALQILKSLLQASRWVFPSPKQDKPLHRGALALALRRARQREDHRLGVNEFSPHDLRRTAASHMASLGVERFVIGRVLNHVEPGVTRVYDRHSYDQEKKKALDRWNRYLRHLVGIGGSEPKVVQMMER